MARMAFDTKISSAFFTGAPTSNYVPGELPVSLNGRPYQVVWDKDAIGVWGAKFKRESLPLLRSQADNSNTPGEQSISPENFWRRSEDNFISGSGQLKQDRSTSLNTRFYTSKGVNPWTPYQLSLLNQTSSVRASANTGLNLCVAGTTAFLTDGATVVKSTDLVTWTTMTGTPSAATSICTDGTTVYTAHGANGCFSGAASGTALASYATGQVDTVAFVKGRLMAAGGQSLYNITGAGALPTALLTKATGWTWVGFAGGQTHIYAAGYSGDKSLIYRTAIQPDGTALTAPTVAGELPDGEIVRSITAYLGYIVIGTALGLRFCSVDSAGNLTIGALITTTSPVYCAEGQDKFVWYGLTNFDGTSTGLGRMDLTTFTSTSTPAYCSDLMATGQGTVRSVKTFNNLRLFTVDGLGVFYETANTPVASGTITTGWISYGISDPKVAVFIDLKHEPLNGTISVSMSTDGLASVVLGTSAAQGSATPSAPFQANQARGSEFQLIFTLTPTANVSPKLTRWTLRAYPAPARSTQFIVPIVIAPEIKGLSDMVTTMDIRAEYLLLTALHETQQIVTYQQGNENYQVVMFDYQFLPEKLSPSGDMEGTFLAYLNEVTG